MLVQPASRKRKRSAARRARHLAVLLAGRELSTSAVMFHSKVAGRAGLGATHEKVLDLLELEGAMTPRELADRLALAPATVTAHLDKLEANGFVHRRPHPEDGRRILVEADEDGDKVAPLHGEFLDSLRDLLSRYSDVDLLVITEALRESARAQRQAAANLR